MTDQNRILYILGKLGKNILHYKFNITDVINESSSCISPYSQHNVINSFIRGMDPDFSLLIKELKDKIQSFQDENYKDPVLSIVDSLPKSDLAEMAEAMVNITALRQHVSTEQETVGGPTDVALITKTDGFVWFKKKQIFHSVQDNS